MGGVRGRKKEEMKWCDYILISKDKSIDIEGDTVFKGCNLTSFLGTGQVFVQVGICTGE